MLELIEAYSIKQILTFVVLLILAIKEGTSLIDWVYKKISGTVHSVDEYQEIKNDIVEIKDRQEKVEYNIDLLIKSCVLDFRYQLVKEHKAFMEQGWIDTYSLSAIEGQFKVYVEEGGNSFAESLMNDIRSLPKEPPKKVKRE